MKEMREFFLRLCNDVVSTASKETEERHDKTVRFPVPQARFEHGYLYRAIAALTWGPNTLRLY
jgi:hypothetical protein